MSDADPEPIAPEPREDEAIDAPRRPGTAPMRPGAERLADLSAWALMVAAILELFLLYGSLMASPPAQSWFLAPQCPLLVLVLGAAVTHLAASGGGLRTRNEPERRALSGVTSFAWLVVAVGVIALLVIAVAMLRRLV